MTLSWTTTDATTFSIDNNIGAVASVGNGSTTTPALTADTTFTGTVNGAGGTVTCPVTVTMTTSGGGGGGGGGVGGGSGGSGGGAGGGGAFSGSGISLTMLPHVTVQPLAYLYLSQIPYTGLDLGPVGTALYWLALIAWSAACAYFVLFGIAPFINRSIRDFGSRVAAMVNTSAFVSTTPSLVPIAVAAAPAATPVSEPILTVPVASAATASIEEASAPAAPEVRSSYSSYDGFKSFAQDGTLSIDDIVKGLSRGRSVSASTLAAAPQAAPVPVAPVMPVPTAAPVEAELPTVSSAATPTTEIPVDTRGFTIALLQGDRTAVFAGLRQYVRGGGAPEQLVSAVACALDDVYRARMDGTPCDSMLERLAARVDTPTLEKLVTALTTAIDSSYTNGMTGAKLALTRALSGIGA